MRPGQLPTAPVPQLGAGRRGWPAAGWLFRPLVLALTLHVPVLAQPQALLQVQLPRAVSAQEALESSLNEQVLMLPPQDAGDHPLELTIYRPPGPGPWPVVLMNHGRDRGSPSLQPRYRPALVAREFVRRGYLVAVPMRPGFSRSGGGVAATTCQLRDDGLLQARTVRRTLAWLAQQPQADVSRNLVLGQSHGGLTTLAYGTAPHPGTRLLLNFAGGLRLEGCVDWQDKLVLALADYGRQTRLPSLWFYGDNDSYFPAPLWRAGFASYSQGGAPAELVAYGAFGDDAHAMFGSAEGLPIWLPRVLAALQGLGLPSQPLPGLADDVDIVAPPASSYARLYQLDKLPLNTDQGRQSYRDWLFQPGPRAFAIHPQLGSWAATWGGERPYARALANCQRLAQDPCKLYAVDNTVVWSPE